ncbi:hypothetical protein Tco_0728388 [Tanacetum coccineum]|uniref:Uncharacterized protein n=1 Tax=Tanacetum coccineum TaxID=301880 RepID=A0ABQ4YNN5_9ASTR
MEVPWPRHYGINGVTLSVAGSVWMHPRQCYDMICLWSDMAMRSSDVVPYTPSVDMIFNALESPPVILGINISNLSFSLIFFDYSGVEVLMVNGDVLRFVEENFIIIETELINETNPSGLAALSLLVTSRSYAGAGVLQLMVSELRLDSVGNP